MDRFRKESVTFVSNKALFEKARLGNAMKSASLQIATHLNGNLS